MTPTMIMIAASAGLATAMLVAALARSFLSPEGAVQDRLAALGGTSPYERREVAIFRDRRESGIPFLDSLLRGRESTPQTRLMLERAGLPLRVGEYMTVRVLVALMGLAAGVILGRTFLGGGLVGLAGPALGLVVGIAFMPLYVRHRIARRLARVEQQLVEFCDLMASMLESGFGYMQAMTTTAEQIGAPLSIELMRMIDAVQLGGDTDEALEEMNERLGSRDFDIIATAIAIQRRSGGNLAEILRSVAETIRDRHSFRREIRAMTSKERAGAIFIVVFPFIIAVVFSFLMPEMYLRLWTDTAGRLILVAAVILDGIGYFFISRALKLEV